MVYWCVLCVVFTCYFTCRIVPGSVCLAVCADMVRAAQRLPQILSPCSFLLWILTHKRFHSNLAIAPTCDTVSTYHITDKARDPQRGLSRATYLLKVSRRAPLWRAGRSAAGGGDAAQQAICRSKGAERVKGR